MIVALLVAAATAGVVVAAPWRSETRPTAIAFVGGAIEYDKFQHKFDASSDLARVDAVLLEARLRNSGLGLNDARVGIGSLRDCSLSHRGGGCVRKTILEIRSKSPVPREYLAIIGSRWQFQVRVTGERRSGACSKIVEEGQSLAPLPGALDTGCFTAGKLVANVRPSDVRNDLPRNCNAAHCQADVVLPAEQDQMLLEYLRAHPRNG